MADGKKLQECHNDGEKDASNDKPMDQPHSFWAEAFSHSDAKENEAYRDGYRNTKHQKED